MAKVVWFPSAPATAAPIRGKAYRVGDGWVFADDDGQSSGLTYIREWTGTTYAAHDDPTLFPYIGSVLWLGASDIWMAYGSYFVQWTGSAWAEVVLDPTYGATVNWLTGTSDSDLYLVGPGPTSTQIRWYNWDGVSFNGPTDVDYTPTNVSNFNTASKYPGVALWAGSDYLTTVTGTPSVDYAPAGAQIAALWQRTSTAAWAVLRHPDISSLATVLYNGGGGWAELGVQPSHPTPTMPTYNAIHGTSDGDVWIVGTEDVDPSNPAYQFICQHWNGSTWTRHTFGPVAVAGTYAGVQELLDVYAAASNDVWVGGYTTAGSGGPRYIAAWHWDGTTWSDRSPTT